MLSIAGKMTIRFRNGAETSVSCVADAAAVLSDKRWPERSPAHETASRLVHEALAGHCQPRIALEAFRKAADEAGILVAATGPKK